MWNLLITLHLSLVRSIVMHVLICHYLSWLIWCITWLPFSWLLLTCTWVSQCHYWGHRFFAGWISFLSPNQQYQVTELCQYPGLILSTYTGVLMEGTDSYQN